MPAEEALSDRGEYVEHPSLYRMPYDGERMAHLVIEVNHTCNIQCISCYKSKSDLTKTLEEIQAEIDWAMTQRQLHVITLAGGEPTLHPDLPAIVRYIADKGLLVQMLTNGTLLDDARLAELAEAGMYKIYLHVDTRQRRPDTGGADSEQALNALREELAARVVSHGIGCAAEITLYQSNFPEIGSLVDLVFRSPTMDWLLVTNYTDFSALAEALGSGDRSHPATDCEGLAHEAVPNAQVARTLWRDRGLRPSAQIPSNKRDTERRWLFYYALVARKRTGDVDVHPLDERFGRNIALSAWAYRKVHGHYPFDIQLTPWQTALTGLVYATLCLHPLIALKSWWFVVRSLLTLRPLTLKALCFQEGPNLSEDGEVEHCRDCPDATVRHGRLVPVCMVDILEPLDGRDGVSGHL